MMSEEVLYKIESSVAWQQALVRGVYEGSQDDRRDGFIHFSTRSQVAQTAAKHFKGRHGLVLIAVDPAPLRDALAWEPSRGGELFPHLYGPLRTDHAVALVELPLDCNGIPDTSSVLPRLDARIASGGGETSASPSDGAKPAGHER
ncbi:MAG: DUF952 domain-containing protein [Hyphomicrobiaceae bacterium]